MGGSHSAASPPDSSDNSRSSESPSASRFELDAELLERIAAGEPARALAREIGVPHSTVLRSLQRPEVADKLRAIKRGDRRKKSKKGGCGRTYEVELGNKRHATASLLPPDANPFLSGAPTTSIGSMGGRAHVVCQARIA